MPATVYVEQAEQILPALLGDLEAIVNIDSGTYTKAGIDRVVAYLEQRFKKLGFTTHIDRQTEAGNHLIATHNGQNPRGLRLLFIGHTDTVFPDQEVSKRPFTITESNGHKIAKGPGVLDMKSGLLMALYALQLVSATRNTDYQSVTFLCNSDEEVGSHTSRPLVEQLAQEADAVFVFEPGRLLHTVVSARKGIGHYRIEVRGVSSHAGVDPQKGRNAILELAHQVVALQSINGTIPGATLNVGVIRGGDRTNIVPDFAYCEIDVRVTDRAGLAAIEEAMRSVTSQTVLDGTTVTLLGGVRSMPFERSAGSTHLVELAKEVGRELGITIQDTASGGASDANTTAAMGIPTLDGLGATGGLAHNPDEYIELDTLALRIALICGLVERVCLTMRSSGKV